MQVEHDDASSTALQLISTKHADVLLFRSHFATKKSDFFKYLFSVFFDTQLVHNYFYSSLKSPVLRLNLGQTVK